MRRTIHKTHQQPPPTQHGNDWFFEKISAPYYYLC